MPGFTCFDVFGVAPQEINETIGGHQPEIEISEKKPYSGIKGCKRLVRVLKSIFVYQKMRKNAKKIFDNVDTFTGAILKENFTSLKDKDLINKLVRILSVFRDFRPVFSASTRNMMAPLIKALEKYFPGQGTAMANALMAGRGEITSAEHGHHLEEMAEIVRGDAAARRYLSSKPFNPLLWEKELPEASPFKKSLRNFMEKYGHRGVYEVDISNPRWREDPTYIFNIIRSTMESADLKKIKARQKEKAHEAWRAVNQRITFFGRIFINYLLKQAITSAGFREMAKSVLMKLAETERLVFEETGRRLSERGILVEPADIYHCAWSEIRSILEGDWGGKGLDVLVTGRKAKKKDMESLSPPDLIIDEVPHYAKPIACSSGNTLTGMGVATGRASGLAKLIYHPDEGGKLQAGDVLISSSTDPAWTPLFLRASAIVMETGGAISHGSIVAREYGIPAVVNVPGAMKIIKDSQSITVDGDEGRLYL